MAKKPWNRINLPVYSISSRAGTEENMHICTYVSAVSMQPKRMMVAIYHGTKTLELVEKNPHFALQLLAAHQYNLVNQLGKQSGHTVPKMLRLSKRQLLTQWNGFAILKDALAVMELKVITEMEGGDHRIFLCDMVAYKNLHEGVALTIDDLRLRNIVRM
jgi:flavin reductase (DIM6/NTAB) family NADH-FMN oxidoreductase RutF